MIVSDRIDEALPSADIVSQRLHAGNREHPSAPSPGRCNAIRRRKSASTCSRRRRSSTMPSRAALTQPQAAIASAMPTWPWRGNSSTAPTADDRKPGERRQHRRAGVFMRERHRGQHLLQRMAGDAERDRGERAGDRGGVARAERAALEQAGDDRPGQQRQADRRRQREAERDLEGARLRARRTRRGRRRGHARQWPASSPRRSRSRRRRAAARRAGMSRSATTPPTATTTPRWCRRSA